MRAFAFDGFDEEGTVHDLPDPTLNEGEALVRVKAAGVNVVDAWVVQGALKDAMEHRFPLIPGVEASGVIEAIGPGVAGLSVGEQVYGVSAKPHFGEGTFAELATIPVDGLAAKPESVEHAEAAAVSHTGLTALTALDEIDPREGQTVLVVGATGGVGSFVTQLVSGRGARVIAVASAERADYARELGAAEVVDYSTGDLVELVRAAAPDGVDAIVDLYSDAAALGRLSNVVHRGGRVLSASGAADPELLAQRGLRGGNINRASPGRLPELTTLLDEKQIRPPETKIHRLEEAGEALQTIQSRHVPGKLVISLE